MSVVARAVADGPDARAVGTRTGELFATHGRMVFALCRAVMRDQNDAEDATQATFLSAHEALVRGVVVREPGSWLATIARNECRARLRSRRAEPLPLHVDELAGSVTLEDDVHRRATVAHLRAAISVLPEKQREAVILRDLYGLRYGEISVALDISRPSVEALLFRARRTLRVRLRPVGGVALGVPLAVREGLAQAVPWFAQGPAGTVGFAAAGAGILAKLAAPLAAKLAVGAVALGITGAAVVEIERGASRPSAPPTSPGPRADPGRVASTPARPLDGEPIAAVTHAASERGPTGEIRASPPPTAQRQPTERLRVDRARADVVAAPFGSSRRRAATDPPTGEPIVKRTQTTAEPVRAPAPVTSTPTRTRPRTVAIEPAPEGVAAAAVPPDVVSVDAESITTTRGTRVQAYAPEPAPTLTPGTSSR